MTESPRILAIGGVDPSGGAGLATDARMIQARGALPMLVPATLTVQNRGGFRELHPVDVDLLRAMVGAALDEGPVSAIKVGLLGTAATVEQIAQLLREPSEAGIPLVVDPVLSATAHGLVVDPDAVAAYRQALLPLAFLVTPNLPETAVLARGDPSALLALGARGVLVKGGHAEGETVEDRLLRSEGEVVMTHPRVGVGDVRGTGCALASAIACELGRGQPMVEAVRSAVAIMGRCLELTPAAPDGRPATLVVV